MSIEKREPTKEFYSALDTVIAHQVKSREAFDKAIEIARKQNFTNLEIGFFIKAYLKEKIPKTSLYRYLGELENLNVPLEQINHNNVLEQKDPDLPEIKDPVYHKHMDSAREGMQEQAKGIMKFAIFFEMSGVPKDKISAKIKNKMKRKLKSAGYNKWDLKSNSKFIDHILQGTEYRDPDIPNEDHLGECIKYILPLKFGGYVPDEEVQ